MNHGLSTMTNPVASTLPLPLNYGQSPPSSTPIYSQPLNWWDHRGRSPWAL